MTQMINDLFWLIIHGIAVLIGLAGVIWGGYELFLGFTGDRPDDRRKGLFILLGMVVAIALIYGAGNIIWNGFKDTLSGIDTGVGFIRFPRLN